MKFYTISNDLSISNDERFGNYDKYTVFELLRNIERNFSICIGKMPYSNTPCKILYHPLHPMIVNVPYERIIFLSVSHNNMFEWIYQFSHEYCQPTTEKEIIKRCFLLLLLMIAAVGLRFTFDINYYMTILLFFLIVDTSVIIKGKSLIDIMTNTYITKRKIYKNENLK